MIPLWKGSANTWDCDEMGHMNVRVYVEKAMEGLGAFAGAIKLPDAFSPQAPGTLIPTRHHIRYMREVLPGRPLTMTGCVIDYGEDWVEVYQEMRHGDGSVSAAFRTHLVHAVAKSQKRFPWSKRSKAALESLVDTPPDETRPRSLNPDEAILPDDDVTVVVADQIGAPMIGLGMVRPSDCDAFGTMWAPWFMGRISDSVPNLLYEWRKSVAHAAGNKPMGAAVLEYMLHYRRWPKAGDKFQVHTSLHTAGEKTHSLVHWMLDPTTGGPWMTCEAVAVTFDLEGRKVLPTSPELLEELDRIAPKGLQI
ncbi:MAG: thioesterase family protein [Pseudomonadota bacterium]